MADTKTEIKQDTEKSKERRNVNLEKVDGKIVSRYNIESVDNKGNWNYDNYTKIFDDYSKFTEYTDKFFNL